MGTICKHKSWYCFLAIIFLFAFNVSVGQSYNAANCYFSNNEQVGFTVQD
jgi:hypothetical protein